MIKAFVRATQTGVHLRSEDKVPDAAVPATSPGLVVAATAPQEEGQARLQAPPVEDVSDLRPPEPPPVLVRPFVRRVGLQLLLRLKPWIMPFLRRFQARLAYALDRSESGQRLIELERRLARLEAGLSQLLDNGRETGSALQASSHKLEAAIADFLARQTAYQEMRHNEYQDVKGRLKRLDDLLLLNGQKGFDIKWEIEHSVKTGLDDLCARLDDMRAALGHLEESRAGRAGLGLREHRP